MLLWTKGTMLSWNMFKTLEQNHHQSQHFCLCFCSLQVATLSWCWSLDSEAGEDTWALEGTFPWLSHVCRLFVKEASVLGDLPVEIKSVRWRSIRCTSAKVLSPTLEGSTWTHLWRMKKADKQTNEDRRGGKPAGWKRGLKNKRSWKAVLHLYDALDVSGSQSRVTWNQRPLTCWKWKRECRNIKRLSFCSVWTNASVCNEHSHARKAGFSQWLISLQRGKNNDPANDRLVYFLLFFFKSKG